MMEANRETDQFAAASPPHSTLAFVLLFYLFASAISAAIIHGRAHGDSAEMFVACVFASQAMLLVMWIGLGNAMLLVRLFCGLTWCVWMTVLGTPEPLQGNIEFLAAAGLMLLFAAAPFGLLKILGVRIVWRRARTDVRWRRDILLKGAIIEPIDTSAKIEVHGEAPANSQHVQRAGVQFTIVQIFGWTALAGVLAVLVRIAGVRLDEVIPISIPIAIATAVGFATLWAVLGGEQVGARMLAPFGLVIIVTVVVMGLGFRGNFIWEVFWMLALTTAATAGVLALFRSAGYRVCRGNRAVIGNSRDATSGTQPIATNPWDAETV